MSLHQTDLDVEVVRPGDDGYDAAARVFFATGEPALVVRPRDPDEIERTVLVRMDVGENGEKAGEVVETLGQLAEAGAQTAIGYLAGVDKMTPLEVIGRDVLPQLTKF